MITVYIYFFFVFSYLLVFIKCYFSSFILNNYHKVLIILFETYTFIRKPLNIVRTYMIKVVSQSKIMRI